MADRKSQILDVAAELLQSRSYTAFSYQDISDRLGITKAAIHGHFRTKEILGVALIDTYIANARDILDNISSTYPNPWDRFDAFVKSIFQQFLADDKICPIGALQSEYKVIPERMRVQAGHLRNLMTRWLTNTLKVGRDEGDMVFAGSPEDQATMILATFQGALQNARAEGQLIFTTVVNQIKRLMTAQ
jgi:TetR/AcrR family transcriptional repressor of nem operon